MNAPARKFEAVPAVRGEEPLAIGMIGPPGGGKTYSALRLAKGIQEVRGGDIVVIDTERGRSRKYADEFKFKHVDFQPPCRSADFLEAIRQQISSKPAAILVDSMSDEHEGIGGYLEWHDELVPSMGGNDWAAWAKPKASRKRLITGLLHVLVPMIFTFRAREKTQQVPDGNRKKVINIGWQPVAPLEIVHALDLTCILPPRAEGVPIWKSDKIGEDFIIKLPMQFKRLFDGADRQLTEEIGRALAEWSRGGQPSPRSEPRTGRAVDQPPAALHQAGGAVPQHEWDDYTALWEGILEEATDAAELTRSWNSDGHKAVRKAIVWPEGKRQALVDAVTAKVAALKQTAGATT